MKLVRLAFGVLYASIALADGSVVMLKQRVGPIDVTLFGNSAHLTTAQTNLSLMVQKASDHSDVPDAHVTLRFTRNENGKIMEVVAPATHAKASNKMLYGAVVTLPNQGYWSFMADIEAQGSHVEVAANLPVGPPEAPLKEKWPLIVFIPVAIVMFIINRRLKRRWRTPYRQARP
ncbi:MAG TPA: hypothetical protein VH302_02970 [Bryobacteraceae bacterium]|nr:hypothetical protein [Bryobacteraceae bacterium]